MNHSILMVRVTDIRTGTIRKFNGWAWVSAGYYMDLLRNGILEPGTYNVEYKRGR